MKTDIEIVKELVGVIEWLEIQSIDMGDWTQIPTVEFEQATQSMLTKATAWLAEREK